MCTERDSPRDQLIVTFFLLVVIGLLLYAAIRSRWVSLLHRRNSSFTASRLQRAIEARGRPKDMRQWSEVRFTASPSFSESDRIPALRLYCQTIYIHSPIPSSITSQGDLGIAVSFGVLRCGTLERDRATRRLALAARQNAQAHTTLAIIHI